MSFSCILVITYICATFTLVNASNIPSFYPGTISSVFTETSDEESLQLLLNGITVVSGPSTIDNSLQPAVKNHRAQKKV